MERSVRDPMVSRTSSNSREPTPEPEPPLNECNTVQPPTMSQPSNSRRSPSMVLPRRQQVSTSHNFEEMALAAASSAMPIRNILYASTSVQG